MKIFSGGTNENHIEMRSDHVGKNTVPIVNNNSYINYAEASANAYASGVQMIAVDYGGIAQVNFAFDGITNFNIQTISTNGVTNNYKNPDDLPPEIQAQIKKAKKLIPK